MNDVYPKPTVSFILPGGEKAEQSDVKFTDLSPSNNSYYLYSERSDLEYTPKYSDHNQNLTCSVFSIGSTNLTVEKSLLMNVEGFEIVSDKCLSYFTADENGQDAEYTCIFFANPPLKPTWSTKKKALELAVDAIKTDGKKIATDGKKIATDLLNSDIQKSDLKKTVDSILTTAASVVSKAVDSASELVQILEQEDADSNYVSSVEELQNGLFKAVLKVKKADGADFKDYTLKFKSTDNTVIEHVVSLKKTGFDKSIKALGSSASILSNNIVHSTLILVISSLFIHLNR